MLVPVTLPELGTTRATFSLWYVRIGERVWEGDRIAEVLIPGASFDVGSPTTGTLCRQEVYPNDPLRTGQVLGWIEADEPTPEGRARSYG